MYGGRADQGLLTEPDASGGQRDSGTATGEEPNPRQRED